jgi:hypothetical protein
MQHKYILLELLFFYMMSRDSFKFLVLFSCVEIKIDICKK